MATCNVASLIALPALLVASFAYLQADEPRLTGRRIGYTELRTNLPGGRHANVRTMRAVTVKADGSGRQLVAQELVDDPDAWTQFVGWSPDGEQAIASRGWQDPANAKWEEQHRRFRMLPGKWQLDSYLIDMKTGEVTNVTSVERVSHYNGGLFFMPRGEHLGFTPLINGVSKPYVMDLDGRNKRDVSEEDAGFAYGYSASPDGELISYHENYQVYIANADGSNKRHIKTGNPFDFAPRWSADGFVSLEDHFGGGTVETKPLIVDGKQLHVNVDSQHGEVRVELLDHSGEPIPSFTSKECMPIRADSADVTVRWKEDTPLRMLTGKPVRLKFHLNKANLYSFWID